MEYNLQSAQSVSEAHATSYLVATDTASLFSPLENGGSIIFPKVRVS